jgi:uncharacterized Zn finger protein (UPF0148 family)
MTTDDETQAMSRLLTQGATMLDEACDGCGNPLFRYQGEVLCPVCQESRSEEENTGNAGSSVGTKSEDRTTAGDLSEVERNLKVLAERLASDAVEHSEDPDAVERRLDALERTLGLLQ